MERTGSVLGLNRGFVAAAQIKRLFSMTPSSSAKKRNGAKISREGMVYDFWRGTSAWRMPGDGRRAEKEEGEEGGAEWTGEEVGRGGRVATTDFRDLADV